MKLENKTKIYGAMNSLARFIEFQGRNAPQILIDEESHILSNYFSSLTKEEMRRVQDLWPLFYERRQVEDAIQAVIIEDRLKREVLSIN